jgi:chitin disaccharide deacetylase
MVGAPAAADAVTRARRMPNLRVGLHVVLVDGKPVSDRSAIPDLVDEAGNLPIDLARFGATLAASRTLRGQLRKEMAAQFEAYRATGLPLDHVDGHRHFQLHPSVASAMFSIGRNYGMQALRVPVEPRRVVVAVDPAAPSRLHWLVAPWAAWLRGRARLAGLTTADAVFGLAWSGAMTRERLRGLLARLPSGLVEIYLHPATKDDFVGAAPGYRYFEEYSALCDPGCIAALRQSGFVAGGYGDRSA